MKQSILRGRMTAKPAAVPARGAIFTTAPSRPRQPLLALLNTNSTVQEPPALLPEQRARVTAVIPARNEAANLPHVLPRIPSWVHEVVLVDGDSTDNTVEVAKSLYPGIRIVPQAGRGKGAALRTGFAAATGDIIVMLDADGSTDPAEIPAFVGKLLTGADFVKGSRFAPGGGTADMSFHRKLGNWAFVLAVRALFGGRYSDLCYGYNAFWARVLPTLKLDGDGFEIETMMNVRALREGLRIAEVPSFEAPRVFGTSNLRALPDGLRVARTILRERLKPDAVTAVAEQFQAPVGRRSPLRLLGRRNPDAASTQDADELIALHVERRKGDHPSGQASFAESLQEGDRRVDDRRPAHFDTASGGLVADRRAVVPAMPAGIESPIGGPLLGGADAWRHDWRAEEQGAHLADGAA